MDSVTCAVCGRSVPLDGDHAEIEVEHVEMNDRNRVDSYVLHEQCALAVFNGWRKPA